MHSAWRCPHCGPVAPLHVAEHIGPEIVASTVERIIADPVADPTVDRVPGLVDRVDRADPSTPPVPLWCPWPLPSAWTITGVGWAGDDRSGVRATAVACSGPSPLGGGPADLVLVAEEPGVGLGARLAGTTGIDPGPELTDALTEAGPGHAERVAPAKVTAGGHPTPLWAVKSPTDRSAYAGEARGIWLYAITWPASAGYLLAEDVVLHDLAEWTPSELVYGAPSPYLHGRV
ncbi:DUF6758 family protein [Plantactinospora sonchi]